MPGMGSGNSPAYQDLAAKYASELEPKGGTRWHSYHSAIQEQGPMLPDLPVIFSYFERRCTFGFLCDSLHFSDVNSTLKIIRTLSSWIFPCDDLCQQVLGLLPVG